MAWIMDGALALWQWSQIYNIQQWKLRSPKVTSYSIHDERITRNGHKQAALVGRGGSLVYGAEARRQSHCENIQYPDSNPLMKFRKRLPNINSKSRPNTLLTPFIAPAMPDPGNVCPIMEFPALKVNRAISMIVSVNIVKNIHVASAMKRHSTSEASFCYQSKETTVPPPLPPAWPCIVSRISLSVLEEPSKRFIGFGRPRNYDVWNLKALVCRLFLFATKTPGTYLLAQPTTSGIWKFCVAVT